MENENDKFNKHILIRFADNLSLFTHNGAINEHKEILKNKGYVWFGKFGRKLSNQSISDLNSQILREIPTVLFLVQSYDKLYNVHMAYLSNVCRTLNIKDLEYVPAYYQSFYKEAFVWFQFSRITDLSNNALKHISVSSSGKNASISIHHSMSSIFIVKIDSGISVQVLEEIK